MKSWVLKRSAVLIGVFIFGYGFRACGAERVYGKVRIEDLLGLVFTDLCFMFWSSESRDGGLKSVRTRAGLSCFLDSVGTVWRL